jgi:hypothetical protein
MLALIQFNLVSLGVALLIGLATGWWMFANRRSAPADRPEEPSRS